MYYESISHRSVPVASAIDAATCIHELRAFSCDALIWSTGNRRFCVVADGDLDHPWSEVAVIDLNESVQIESITFAWVKTLEEKIQHLVECETTEFRMRKALLPLDGEGESKKVMFTCSCCGKEFQSTIKEQWVFDQDDGYGKCPKCIKRFGE